jgi:5-methylcytosine-specific restriction endonuclease McrA
LGGFSVPQHTQTLVLNADYRPLGVIDWRRAVTLSCKNQEDPNQGLMVVEYYDNDFITGASGQKYPVPAVVRSPNYIKHRHDRIPFSRKNVFIRDQFICQYCGKKFSPSELTYDHVIPRCKWKDAGTPTQFTNIVSCCLGCNQRKAGQTPKEAKMKLLREPVMPNMEISVLGINPWSKIPDKWLTYLPQLYREIYKNNQ